MSDAVQYTPGFKFADEEQGGDVVAFLFAEILFDSAAKAAEWTAYCTSDFTKSVIQQTIEAADLVYVGPLEVNNETILTPGYAGLVMQVPLGAIDEPKIVHPEKVHVEITHVVSGKYVL